MASAVFLGAVWLLELVRLMVAPGAPPGTLLIALFCTYLLLALLLMSNANRLLAGGLCAAGFLAAPDLASFVRAIGESSIFAAYLPAVQLVQITARGTRSLERIRERFGRMPTDLRRFRVLVTSHLASGVLGSGALAAIGPALPTPAGRVQAYRDAMSLVAGVSLGVLWSPVFVGMGLTLRFFPDVALWQPIMLGGLIALLCLIVVAAFGPGARSISWRAVCEDLRALGPLVGGLAVLVTFIRGLGIHDTLASVCLALPMAGALFAAASPARRRVRLMCVQLSQVMARMHGEVAVIAFAAALAATLSGSPYLEAAAASLSLTAVPAPLLVGGIVFCMPLGAMAGVHPLVIASVLLAVLTSQPLAVPELMLVESILLGWACAAMVAVSGLVVIVTSALLNLRNTALVFGANLKLVPMFAAIGLVVLGGTDLALSLLNID